MSKTEAIPALVEKTELYFNREMSWIQFNKRVLEEAANTQHPLLERLKFLVIFGSNLDEFFMIRLAALKEQIETGVVEPSADGVSPRRQFAEIRRQLLPLLERQAELLMNDVLPKLREKGVVIDNFESLSGEEKQRMQEYFYEDALPVLTPLALDTTHPFPRLLNRSLNIAFVLRDETSKERPRKIAVLQVPSVLRRFVQIKRSDDYRFVLLEQIIQHQAQILFPGLEVEDSFTFRVTRDADIEIAEDEAGDLITEMAEQIRQRRWGYDAVRLEVEADMPNYLVHLLMNSLELETGDVYVVDRPLNLPDFLALMKLDERELKDPPFNSRKLPEFLGDYGEVFDAIRKHDLMVHHPFDSFTNSVVKFLQAAADDPQVLAVKITLYRAGGSSPVVDALKRAAENGKQVTAFVELKARFDEENNILWARELEREGVHVVYGILGLKTHCKIALVVRKERNRLRTYVHLGTGNYNLSSSRMYTDVGYFTAREEFANDGIHLFNMLTGYSHHREWEMFAVSPQNLKQKILELIAREVKEHSPEKPGVIYAKMNGLVDSDVINALYKASQKGVGIRLLVRGICCLRPGVAGLSENIEVRSILGRFLEHSRIFYFGNGGNPEYYMSSADWMPRNFERRVEVLFPVPDTKIKTRLHHLLTVYWRDNLKARVLQPDGSYQFLQSAGEEVFDAQRHLLTENTAAGKKSRGKKQERDE